MSDTLEMMRDMFLGLIAVVCVLVGLFLFIAMIVGFFTTAFPERADGEPFTVHNRITDVSFVAQHEEKHCNKGCRYTTVPDKWFVLFCNIERSDDCFTRSITHAPWAWQTIGTTVDVVWQPRTNWWSIWNTLDAMVLQSGERVSL